MVECPSCDEEFDSRQGMKIHHGKVHDDPLAEIEGDKLPCPSCNRFFNTEQGRSLHHSIVHGESLLAEVAECENCGQEFEYYPSSRRGVNCSDCAPHSDAPYGRKSENKEKIKEVKMDSACVCGEDEWRVLEFHHLDSEEKDGNIYDMVGKPWQIIQEEISKCEIVCRNCHIKIHSGIKSIS